MDARNFVFFKVLLLLLLLLYYNHCYYYDYYYITISVIGNHMISSHGNSAEISTLSNFFQRLTELHEPIG